MGRYVDSVIARLLSDLRNRTMIRRRLGTSLGAVRRIRAVRSVRVTVHPRTTRPAARFAVPAHTRPGTLPVRLRRLRRDLSHL